MTRDELNNRYFEWMYGLVCDNTYFRGNLSYRKLLMHLHSVKFTYILDMDANRAADGVDLRYKFGYEFDYPDPMIASYLDDRECSVLEMMIALVRRCEDSIMEDPDIGDRKSKWFWKMIISLGLGSMRDDRFDRQYVDDVIFCFLDRDYDPNGKGGLFTLKHCKTDLRKVDIWYQMMWYLNEFIEEESKGVV